MDHYESVGERRRRQAARAGFFVPNSSRLSLHDCLRKPVSHATQEGGDSCFSYEDPIHGRIHPVLQNRSELWSSAILFLGASYPMRAASERYPADSRWPDVLQKELGSDYEVIN